MLCEACWEHKHKDQVWRHVSKTYGTCQGCQRNAYLFTDKPRPKRRKAKPKPKE